MTKIIATTPEELEAARLEGLAPATLVQRLLVSRGNDIQEQIDKLELELKTIKKQLDDDMNVEGLKGLLGPDGRKLVERAVVAPSERFDWSEFAKKNTEVVAGWMIPKAGWTAIKLL